MSLALAGLFTTACNEDFADWASPQTNGPENAITIPGFKAAAVETQNLATTGEEVFLFNLVLPNDTYAPNNARIELTPQGIDDPQTTLLNTTADGKAPKEVLQELIVSTYGKRPDVRTFEGHVLVDAMKDGQALLIDAGTIEVKLIAEAPRIAPAYYIVGGTKDWAGSAASKEQKFSHSDLDVYEDPVFTIVIDAAEGDTWFAIGDDEACDAIGEGDWSKLLGIVGGDSKATSGSLDYRYNMGADNSFCVPAGSKKIKVTIDMMEYTFTVQPVNIADSYYLIGGPGEWNNSKAQKFSHSNKDVFDDPVFTYVFEGSGGDMWFAFGDEEAIDAVGEGVWNKLFGTTGASEDLKGTFDRRYNLDGDHSFHVDGQAKYYRFSVNMAEMTYEITPLNFAQYVYFIGATDGWSAAEQKLESPALDGVYTGYVYCADPNGWGNEFKFQRVAGSWDNEINSATFAGGITGDFGPVDGNTNIAAKAGEGIYYVTLDLAAGTLNAVKVEKMGIIGDFNGWGGDAEMTWNATDYCFEVTGAGVNANGWKFRVNADWAINLGSNDSTEPSTVLSDLVANGKNIGVVGNTIKLYPTRKTSDKIFCTVE
jgi:hypothetical protein